MWGTAEQVTGSEQLLRLSTFHVAQLKTSSLKHVSHRGCQRSAIRFLPLASVIYFYSGPSDGARVKGLSFEK